MSQLDEAIATLKRIMDFHLLEDEDHMHPVGCATWRLEAETVKEEIEDFLEGA